MTPAAWVAVGVAIGVAVTLAALLVWRWIDRLPSSFAP
jgi:hypothetical protein